MLYITLRQYEYIVGVADAGSLTQAARQLNVSQPSLSVAITRVEERLNQPLFRRGKGAAIDITPYGHRVVAMARSVLELAAQIEQGEATPQPFVLGCFEDIAPWYLPSALDHLKGAFPEVSFHGRACRFSEIAHDLETGQMDVAISYDVGFEANFNRRRLRRISPVAFLSTDHTLAANADIELSDLARSPLILFEEDQSEGFMQALFDRMRIAPLVQHRVSSLEMMRSMAAHGAGVGVSYTYPPGNISYDEKPLVTMPIATPQARADISLIWSDLRPDQAQFAGMLDSLSNLLCCDRGLEKR